MTNNSDRDRAIVVGGGIVGLATALALGERGYRPVVLEAESRVAMHQTGHNSGVIHSGLYYKPGSLKGRMCRSGFEAMYRFCEEEGIPHRRCGKMVVAVHKDELTRLAKLEERGRANGVTVRRLTRGEMLEREPEVGGIAGLWVEETGVVNYSQVAEHLARRLTLLGGEVRVDHRVIGIRKENHRQIVESTGGVFQASLLVNCAGLQCDRVARLAGVEPGIRIVPFRGEYYKLRMDRSGLVRGLIYPVPDPDLPFLGVHFTRGIDGVVEAGPNAVLALKREGYAWGDISLRDIADMASFPGFWKVARHHWRTGASEVRRSLSRKRFLESLQSLIPALADGDIEAGGSGVRAQAVDADGRLIDDFHIQMRPGLVNILNAPSPAATASFAIAREITERILAVRSAA
jgi:(S)-2-hydroxyglutarate dehydrogenase